MNLTPFLKAVPLWLGIAVLAVANGWLRDVVLTPLLSRQVTLPLSGITLCVIVKLVSYFSIGWIGRHPKATYYLIGAQWLCMTLAFEFLFGHFIVGKSWLELLQTFNVLQGDLFVLVLIVSFLAPYLSARSKGFI